MLTKYIMQQTLKLIIMMELLLMQCRKNSFMFNMYGRPQSNMK